MVQAKPLFFSHHITCPLPTPSPTGASLEALSDDLLPGSLDGGRAVGVDEAATLLVVLEGRSLGRADAEALRVVGAAGRGAVGVGNAAASNELLAPSVAHVAGTGIVGSDNGEGRDGDCSAWC